MAATVDIVKLNYGEEKRQTTAQEHPLGQTAELPDGRSFRYIFMDGAVTAGKLLQCSANVADHDMDLVTAAAAAGATTVTVTLGGTALAADAAKDGYLYVNDGPGEGQLFKIDTHAAVAASGSFVVPIKDEGGVRTALTASSLCGIMYNPWKDVIIAPTTFTGHIVGATTRDMSDNNYGWAQRTGVAAILINGTVTIGEGVSRGATTAGSVDADNYGGTAEIEHIGTVTLIVAVTTDYGLINMHLNP